MRLIQLSPLCSLYWHSSHLSLSSKEQENERLLGGKKDRRWRFLLWKMTEMSQATQVLCSLKVLLWSPSLQSWQRMGFMLNTQTQNKNKMAGKCWQMTQTIQLLPMWKEEERRKVNTGLLLLRKSQNFHAPYVKKDSPHRSVCCGIVERLIWPKGVLNATSAGNRSKSKSICETTCAHIRASGRSSAAYVERPFPLLQIFPAMDSHTLVSVHTGVTFATKPSVNHRIYVNTVSIFTAMQHPHPVQTALPLLSVLLNS